jgi:hypothetical protein
MHVRRIVWLALAALSVGLIALAMWRDCRVLLHLLQVQVLGADYYCFWAGAKTALKEPQLLYDFIHNTDVQGWPLGPRDIRPYIYPPSALFVFIPFALVPSFMAGFALWVAATGALYLWAARTAGAPWWVALSPCVLLVVDCGQMPFIMGGLVIGALALKARPNLAGVMLGVAACLKPQFVLLVPLAFALEGRWRTLIVAGATGLALCLASALVWGPDIWFDWLRALPRFKALVTTNPGLLRTGATPYAWLTGAGHQGAWAYLLAPVALAGIWLAFRKPAPTPDRLIALFGATLLISPYAMNYEYVLLAPSVATYLARFRDPRWPLYALLTAGFLTFIWAPPALYFALALPLLRRLPTPAWMIEPDLAPAVPDVAPRIAGAAVALAANGDAAPSLNADSDAEPASAFS